MYNFINPEEYKKIIECIPISCIDLIIENNNKILLVYRNNEPVKNQWWFPGGRIFKKEKLKDAAIRQAYEELGIKTKLVKKLSTYDSIFDTAPFKEVISGVHCVSTCFLIKINNKTKIKLDNQSSKYKWINKVEKDLHPYVKLTLNDSKIFSKNKSNKK